MTTSAVPGAVFDVPILIFDGDCGICTSLAEFARAWVRPEAAIAPWQRLDLPALGLTEEQCRVALQWVDAGRSIHSAQDAVARLLLAGRPWWRPLGALLLIPGVHWFAGVAYRWVATHRYRLPGGTPACAVDSAPR
jgi:predicted DCC family thiol-disulfide oxidoreductase YuxK